MRTLLSVVKQIHTGILLKVLRLGERVVVVVGGGGGGRERIMGEGEGGLRARGLRNPIELTLSIPKVLC